jgi:hypothetical protein
VHVHHRRRLPQANQLELAEILCTVRPFSMAISCAINSASPSITALHLVLDHAPSATTHTLCS